MTADELAAQITAQFTEFKTQFTDLNTQFADLRTQFADLRTAMDQGFNDSKTRDEELRDLMKFGLEAREVLRDDMHRRFDKSDKKHDEQIVLLKDAVRHLSSHK